jgi:hypothetical protein
MIHGTSNCGSRDFLVLYSPNSTVLGTKGPSGKGSYLGFVCNTQYLTAHVPVNVIISNTNSTISVDDTVFNQTKVPISSSFINETQFEYSFIGETATNHLQYIQYEVEQTTSPNFTGPILALAAMYNGNVSILMSANNLIERSQTVKQRFFGEAVSPE